VAARAGRGRAFVGARAVTTGYGEDLLIAGVACSRQIEEETPVDQERIDDYCSASCKRSADCGQLHAPHGYATCFTDCSTGEYMRWGDDNCQEAMWEFYDCRIEDASSCEDWGSLDETRACHSRWESYTAACWEWIKE
jgi:hypothetical protein